MPLCIDLSFSELTGPLSAFQGRPLDSDGVRRLVQDISAASEKPMPAAQVAAVFDAMWPRLEAAVTEAINSVPPDAEPRRSVEEMLEELVERIRRIDRQGAGEEFVVFTKNYVGQGLLSKTTYGQGTSGLVTKVHTGPGGEITHVDIRLPEGEFLPKVPIDYFAA